VSRYAVDTSVPVEKSKAEIEKTLTRYGASKFIYGWDEDRAMVSFTMTKRQIRFVLPLPDKGSAEIALTATGKKRNAGDAERAWEQACRQKWRALALVIKAKLEAVESGITEFDDEFMAHIVLPNGQTFGEWARPQIAAACDDKKMPPLLPGVKK
jgi:hypothetical protein